MKHIPKGSVIIANGGDIYCKVLKDLHKGYIPKPNDFNPPIPDGFELTGICAFFKGNLIYSHPYFTKEESYEKATISGNTD